MYGLACEWVLTLIQRVLAGPSTFLTLEVVDTVASTAPSYRLHLNNISYAVSFSMHIPFARDNLNLPISLVLETRGFRDIFQVCST